MKNNFYYTKINKQPGADYSEIIRIARSLYKGISSKTKRKPYIRSAYFLGEKIFLDYFWRHLFQKNQYDRLRRLKYYGCALDLIRNSKIVPTMKESKERRSEILYRFYGITAERDVFSYKLRKRKETETSISYQCVL